MKSNATARPQTIRILLVEDDASDAYLVQNALDSEYPGEFILQQARSLEEALPSLQAQQFDVALLDLSLPDSSELDALKSLRHGAPHLPLVILTGYDNEALALSAMQHGAQDYLVKEQADGQLMKRAIRYAIERKHFDDNLTALANYDTLTGLANRSLFISRLNLALARTRRSGETLALFFIDLDRFKYINDWLGHDAGDALLKKVAVRLSGALRECDTVARFGGDEFAVLLEGNVDPRSCAVVAQKMIDMLTAPFLLPGGEASIGSSIGIVLGGRDIAAEELLKHADTAMYRAKEIVKSNFQFYTERMHQETMERLKLEHDFVQAILHKESLVLYYQPKIDTQNGRLTGAEALIRWQHPMRGMLMPAQFLPVLQPAMAIELDRWVLKTVCRDIKCWQAAGLKPIQISIHISNRRWENASVVDFLLEALEESKLETKCLAVELEESAVKQEDENGCDILSRVRETGIEVHLDNFGMGISSLKLLASQSLDAIKIDRRLTETLDKEDGNLMMVHALVDLGHTLGMKVIAEGVETLKQHEALAAMACDQIQGISISKPLPALDFFNWMGTHHG